LYFKQWASLLTVLRIFQAGKADCKEWQGVAASFKEQDASQSLKQLVQRVAFQCIARN